MAILDIEQAYLAHLSPTDRSLLHEAAGPRAPVLVALADPATEQAVFGTLADAPLTPATGPALGAPGRGSAGPHERVLSVGVTPFLTFAVAVERTALSLRTATFTQERWAPRVRIPLFDVATLRDLLAEPERRYFLTELLASYTRVTSGVAWTRTARGFRRRRFSEMDPVRMVALLEVVDPAERPGILRRLGDLALFLLGVFPDHPLDVGRGAGTDRLLRLSGVPRDRATDLSDTALLEMLGARWYRAAANAISAAGLPATGSLDQAPYMAEHFDDARRVLNVVTDRYLFPWREAWFA